MVTLPLLLGGCGEKNVEEKQEEVEEEVKNQAP